MTKILFAALNLITSALPLSVLAQFPLPPFPFPMPGGGRIPLSGGGTQATQVVGSVSDIMLIINRVINYFLAFVLAVSVIMIIYAGFNFMKGSEEGITAGKQTLTYAIVGIIVAVLAYSVKAVVMSILQA